MSVEVECYRLRRCGEDTLEKSLSVAPGDHVSTNYLGKVRVLTFCDISNEICHVWLRGSFLRKHVFAALYDGEDDIEGKPVLLDSENPVRLKKQQNLRIRSRRGPKKEVYVYLDSDDDPEDISVDPPVDDNVLVPV